jgi:hypothetical protein
MEPMLAIYTNVLLSYLVPLNAWAVLLVGKKVEAIFLCKKKR